MTRRTGNGWVSKRSALALTLLVLTAAGNDSLHELSGGLRHATETAVSAAPEAPLEQDLPLEPPSHEAANCPLCGVGRIAGAVPDTNTSYIIAVHQMLLAEFLPETQAPLSPHHRRDAPRAPPARPSA